MRSSLYRCRVMHNRLSPKVNRFHYDLFMFYLDLDELEYINSRVLPVSVNSKNLFTFRDSDFMQIEAEGYQGLTTKQKLIKYLSSEGIELADGRFQLLTHLRTMGYIFNPVSFYFCYNSKDEVECAVVEVCNTYRERKLYLLRKEQLNENALRLKTPKLFYVSPFIEMDTHFDFNLQIPDEKLNIRIDDYKEGQRFFISTLTGERKPLTNSILLKYAVLFPFITVRVITLIHWQALKLWLKKLPYFKKKENLHLQQGIINPK